MMKIQLGGLSEGTHPLRFSAAAGGLGLDHRFGGEVVVQAELQKRGQEHLLRASVVTSAECVCDRCLEPFRLPLSPSYMMYYVVEGGGSAAADPSELQLLPPGETVVDITEDVRQTIILAVPQKLLCREGCRGLCPNCGANLNTTPCSCSDGTVDPRWEGLNNVRDPRPARRS